MRRTADYNIMRCLYCGNELALLKKLTGHGEFCSEAHRQKYQEQYNRLALTRLLQAQDTEAERRPLNLSTRPGSEVRGAVVSGPSVKQLPSATHVAPGPRKPDYPDLSGFVPHQFEPALSPAELFSSEPFLSPVTACLPSSVPPGSALGIRAPEPASYAPDAVARQGCGDAPGEALSGSVARMLEGRCAVVLSLQRIESAPIRDESSAGFPFTAQFGDTIAGLLTLLDAVEYTPVAASAGRNGTSRNGRNAGTPEPSIRAVIPELAQPRSPECRPDEAAATPADALAGTPRPAAFSEPAAVFSGPAASSEPPAEFSERAAAPSEPPTASAKPPAPLTEPPVTLSEPPVALSEPSAPLSEPPVALSEPSVALSEPPVALSEPPVALSEPPVALSEPTGPFFGRPAEFSDRAVEFSEPPVALSEPPVALSEPPVALSEPPVALSEPTGPFFGRPAEFSDRAAEFSDRAVEFSEPPAASEPPAEFSERPAASEPLAASSEPDAILFEPPPSQGDGSPAVVVNLDALKEVAWAPPTPVRTESVSVIVADSEEVRRFLGWLEEEVLPRPSTPAAEEPELQDEAKAVSEPVGLPVELPAAEAMPPAKPAADSAPQREVVPVARLEYVEVLLQLAGDAFAPINEAEFAGPDFLIQTPAITSAPLRAKVLFGPNPGPEAERPDALIPRDSGGAPAQLDVPRRQEEAVREETSGAVLDALSSTRRTRRAEDAIAPEEAAPPVAGAAHTAARLRSMAALARKAQQDLADPPAAAPIEPSPAARRDAPPPEPPPSPAARPDPDTNLETLRFEMERMGAPVSNQSVRSRRILVVVGLVLAMLLVSYLIKLAFASKPQTTPQQSRIEAYGPSMVSGDNGWSLWADQKGGAFPGRQIYIFRPSLSMSDYRIEFKGEIEAKGLGWFFRAANERNYYLMKLEMVKTGLEPKVMLSRTAVINGEETQKSRAELPMKVNLDTVYRVRTDVWRTTFKTYIQDQLVDTWVDDRLATGGFGLLRDVGERSQVRLIQLHGLRLVTE